MNTNQPIISSLEFTIVYSINKFLCLYFKILYSNHLLPHLMNFQNNENMPRHLCFQLTISLFLGNTKQLFKP
jgi:hypothetical protein